MPVTRKRGKHTPGPGSETNAPRSCTALSFISSRPVSAGCQRRPAVLPSPTRFGQGRPIAPMLTTRRKSPIATARLLLAVMLVQCALLALEAAALSSGDQHHGQNDGRAELNPIATAQPAHSATSDLATDADHSDHCDHCCRCNGHGSHIAMLAAALLPLLAPGKLQPDRPQLDLPHLPQQRIDRPPID